MEGLAQPKQRPSTCHRLVTARPVHDKYQLLVHRHFAFDQQLLLADLIGDLAWAYDLQSTNSLFTQPFDDPV